MIRVIYGDAKPLLKDETFFRHLEKLDSVMKTRILTPARSESRACRMMTYLMLEALHKRVYSSPLPPILVTELGKPYLKEGPAFSVSHDGTFVAIAMTDDYGEVGVDMQSEPNPVTASRVRRRFLTPPPPYRRGEPEVEFMMAHLERDGVDITPAHAYGTPSSFLCDFVRAEAVMKMTGGGFADFPRLREICATCETFILPMDDVAIALAYRNKTDTEN